MDKALVPLGHALRGGARRPCGCALHLACRHLRSTRPDPDSLGPKPWRAPRHPADAGGVLPVWEISRRRIAGNQDAAGFLGEAFDRGDWTPREKQPVYPRLLISGIVLMAIYAGAGAGARLSSSARSCSLAAFMYVGGYRAACRHLGRERCGDDLLRHSVPARCVCFTASAASRRSIASPTIFFAISERVVRT